MQKILFKVTMIQVYIYSATQGLSELQLQIKVSVKKWKLESTIFFKPLFISGIWFYANKNAQIFNVIYNIEILQDTSMFYDKL